MTTALETAASTIAPRALALHVPITSSITNNTAEMGALNAAARPAAAPTGASSLQLVPGKFQTPAERGSDSRSHLQGRIFRTKRLAAADRQRTRQKFSDDGSEGHVPVEYVDGGLGLVHAAAAGAGKEFLDQKSDDQAGSRRHQ